MTQIRIPYAQKPLYTAIGRVCRASEAEYRPLPFHSPSIYQCGRPGARPRSWPPAQDGPYGGEHSVTILES